MESVQTVGAMLGLGLLSGIRLYLTLFALGLIVRLNWINLPFPAEHLGALASTPVLVLSGAACGIEFIADKIPWVDSLWDSIHTFVRPIGAALLGLAVLEGADASTQIIMAILAGGAAFTSHASKASMRLSANHSPEPFSNLLLSAAEDLVVPAGLWFTLHYPTIAMLVVIAFCALFAWLAPKLFRILRLEFSALAALIRRWGGSPSSAPSLPPLAGMSDTLERFVREKLGPVATSLPGAYRETVQANPPAVRCAPARGLRALHRSIGYLCIESQGLLFVTSRHFRIRTHAIPWSQITAVTWHRGLFLDTLQIELGDRKVDFDVFKARNEGASQSVSLSHQLG